MLDKFSSWKSSASVETLIQNKEESESETSVATTDESSDDFGDKCAVTFYRWQTLEKRIPKSKIDVLFNIVKRCKAFDQTIFKNIKITNLR